ncbi:MAG: hypothetical protein JKY66_07930 [Spongiibacteraceae bacterium]|nr:hypothetical protein [Spongiibacteraceae bacterium]
MNLYLLRNVFILSLILTLVSCGGGGGGDGGPSPTAPPSPSDNIKPTVNLGDDRVIIEQEVVTITANASDEDGVIASYRWEWVSESDVLLAGDDSETVSFSAPQLLTSGADSLVLSLQLTVTDNSGATSSDLVLITVTRLNNISPTANAGNDQQVIGGETVTLRGRSSDEDGSIVSIQWVQTSGQAIDNLVGDNSNTVTFDAPEQSTEITLTMTVTDNNAATSSDSVTISVSGGDFQDADNDGITDEMDVDDDNDGLIEISSLEELDWVRNNLLGTSLKTQLNGSENDSGCPGTNCKGYELVADLNFDTNNDGDMNEEDAYYDYHGDNSNKGWLPIGTEANPFVAIFEGNGYAIINLYINRLNSSDSSGVGLFGWVGSLTSNTKAKLSNISLTGNLMSIAGEYAVGSLAGGIANAEISFCHASGKVEAGYLGAFILVGGIAGFSSGSVINASYTTSEVVGNAAYAYAGGLVGQTIDTRITSSYARGAIEGANAGGLIGIANVNTELNASYFSGSVKEIFEKGGLVGSTIPGNISLSISASYWAIDGQNPETAVGGGGTYSGSASGVLLSELKCPESATNSTCVSSSENVTLYEGWDSLGPWVFGSNQELPRFVD